jgi:hypothetical protein
MAGSTPPTGSHPPRRDRVRRSPAPPLRLSRCTGSVRLNRPETVQPTAARPSSSAPASTARDSPGPAPRPACSPPTAARASSSTTYCFEGGWLCANNHPATTKAATIAPTRTIRENNIPSLYLFRRQFGRNAARTHECRAVRQHARESDLGWRPSVRPRRRWKFSMPAVGPRVSPGSARRGSQPLPTKLGSNYCGAQRSSGLSSGTVCRSYLKPLQVLSRHQNCPMRLLEQT